MKNREKIQEVLKELEAMEAKIGRECEIVIENDGRIQFRPREDDSREITNI